MDSGVSDSSVLRRRPREGTRREYRKTQCGAYRGETDVRGGVEREGVDRPHQPANAERAADSVIAKGTARTPACDGRVAKETRRSGEKRNGMEWKVAPCLMQRTATSEHHRVILSMKKQDNRRVTRRRRRVTRPVWFESNALVLIDHNQPPTTL